VNSNTKLQWCCGKGHIWSATPHDIASGRWCPQCAGRKKRPDKYKQGGGALRR
jgi:hypothetical protein